LRGNETPASGFGRLFARLRPARPKGDDARKVSRLIWGGFSAMIVMVLVVGGFSLWSFWHQAESFEDYDRVVNNTALVLQIDRDIVAVRRNFASFIQTGKADRMQRVDELLAGLDKRLATLIAGTKAPDRRQVAERLSTLVAGLRGQMAQAAEKRQLRDTYLADIRPLGAKLREITRTAKGGDALEAMEQLMRTRLAIARLVEAPSEAARKETLDFFLHMEEAMAKLSLSDDRAKDLTATIGAFKTAFESTADAAIALDRLVDESIEYLGQEAATASTQLRSLQSERMDALRGDFHKAIEHTLAVIGVMSVLALAVALIIASTVLKMVMTPIDEMARAAAVAGEIGEIIGLASEGDFRNRVATEHRSGFVRVIGDHVNSLFDSVTDALGAIRRAVDIMSSSATTAAGAVTEVSSGADSQAAALQQVRSALHMSAEAITKASDSAQEANVASERATRLVSGSTAVITKLVGTIEAIADHSRKVAQIAGGIAEIAQRTNILATSTGIEAARKSNDGNVFGVIAQQINTLSEACAKAAREIGQVTEASAKDTQAGLAIAAEAQSMVGQILGRVEETDTMLHAICEAMMAQQSSSTEISTTVDSLAAIAEQNVMASRDISQTLERLRLLGVETAEQVARFKIGD